MRPNYADQTRKDDDDNDEDAYLAQWVCHRVVERWPARPDDVVPAICWAWAGNLIFLGSGRVLEIFWAQGWNFRASGWDSTYSRRVARVRFWCWAFSTLTDIRLVTSSSGTSLLGTNLHQSKTG